MSTQPNPQSPGWQGPPQGQPPAWGAAPQPPQPYQGQPPQPYQGQPAQPYQGQPAQPGQPYQGQQAYPPQSYVPQGAATGQGFAPPPTPGSPKPRSSRTRLIVLSAVVLAVVLGLVAWLVVVPLFQTGPTLSSAKIDAIFDPALGSVGYDPTETTTDPAVLFPASSATGCTEGMRAALARSTVARTLIDKTTKAMGEQGYVALYPTVAEARKAAKEIDASLLTCPGFTAYANRLGKSPGYRDYSGSLKVAGAKTSYTSATLAQYGNVVMVTVVAGMTFAADRANRLKERMDTLG
jgi:hypothetical protein